MRATSLVWMMALLLPGTGYAGGMACQLPDIGTQEVSTASETTKRAYRDYFGTLLTLAKKNDVSGLERCCASASRPHVTRSICSLLSYVGGEKKDPKRFLQNTPRENDEVNWLWRWDALLLSQPNQEITAKFPSGVAAYYIDQVYSLIDTEPLLAMDRLLNLDRYADGEYGQYISDKLLTLFKGRPELVIAHWQRIRPYKSSIERMAELYADEVPLLQKQFDQKCATASMKESCTEIKQTLKTK